MSKMSEYHYNKPQEDDPSIEYHMLYPEKKHYTPRIDTWYNKKYANPKNYKPKWCQYVKAEKVRLPF